jgi:hypothetical protein
MICNGWLFVEYRVMEIAKNLSGMNLQFGMMIAPEEQATNNKQPATRYHEL